MPEEPASGLQTPSVQHAGAPTIKVKYISLGRTHNVCWPTVLRSPVVHTSSDDVYTVYILSYGTVFRSPSHQAQRTNFHNHPPTHATQYTLQSRRASSTDHPPGISESCVPLSARHVARWLLVATHTQPLTSQIRAPFIQHIHSQKDLRPWLRRWPHPGLR